MTLDLSNPRQQMNGKKQSWPTQAATFILGLGILAALIYLAGFDRFAKIILKTSPYWLAVSFIIYGTSWIFRTWRLVLFTSLTGVKIKALDVFKLHVSGYALNTIFPAKLGDLAMVGYLKMKGVSLGLSAAIIIQTRILDLIAIILLSIPAFVLFFGEESLGWVRSVILLCVLIAAIPIGVVILDRKMIFSRLMEKMADRLGRKFLKTALEKIRDLYEGYHKLVYNRNLLLSSILLSLAIWFLDGLTCYAVSIAVGARTSLILVILAVSIGNVGKGVPVTPGGVGIYESVLAAVLALFGLPFDLAVVIGTLDHLIKKLFTLAFGLPATAGLGLGAARVFETVGSGGEDLSGS